MKKQLFKTIRNYFGLCALSFLSFQSVYAQAPQKMSYQAVIRDAADNLLPNQNIGVQISVLQGSPVGSAVYVETHAATTNDNGLVSLEVGAGSPVSGSFTSINWASGSYYLQTETDPAGGTNYTITGTTQLLSVPYALYAETSGSGGSGGGSGSDFDLNCSTSFNNNYVIRGTGSGNWECTNDMVITSTGRVGINATSPSTSYDLTIGSGGFLVNGSSSSSAIAGRLGVGTTSPSSSYDLTVGSSGFLVSGSSTNTSNIQGRLRIGSTSNTSYDLQVDGQTYITNGLRVGTTTSPSTNGIIAQGNIRTNTSFQLNSTTSGSGTNVIRTSGGLLRPQSSTIRVKENVNTLSFDKEKLMALRPVTYNLKPALGGDFEVGLIAEEVEKHLPQLVVYGPARQWVGDTGIAATDDEGNEILDWNTMEPYSVYYDRLAVFLLEVVKEQEARIKQLEELLGAPAVGQDKTRD